MIQFIESDPGNFELQENVIIGLQYRDGCKAVVIGENSVIRANSVIYADVVLGSNFQSGHNVMIREKTVIGDHVTVGTNTVIDGNVEIGSYVKIESNCYIPTHVKIGTRVFFGPNVTLTNDKYPLKLRDEYEPLGPVIEDGVTLGAGSIVLPGVTVGEDAMVAAGAVVTSDVPAGSLVVGSPGKAREMPEKLRERNMALSWRKFLE